MNLKLIVIILQLISEFIIIISKNYSKTYIIQYFIELYFSYLIFFEKLKNVKHLIIVK
jgi:hypothetical protein